MSRLILTFTPFSRAELDIDERITFISGNSYPEKEILIENLSFALNTKSNSLISKEILDKVVICRDEDSLYQLSECSRKLIFIDNYDNFLAKHKKLILKEMSRCDCTWIIFSDNPDFTENYGFSDQSFKKLISGYTNGVHLIKTISRY